MTQAVNLANFANNLDSSGGVSPSALNAAVPIAKGGTNATTASAARTNLGLVIGTDVPSPTGAGASGTWGINITGNAATATTATTAATATTASSVTNGVYTTGDQTIGGTKTFTNGVRFNDGSTQTTAAVGPRSWQSLSMPNYTNITNTFGKEIFVSAWCNPNGAFGWTDQCFVDNVLIVVATWDAAVVGMSYVFPVPAGSTFRVEFPTGVRGAMVYR